MPIKIVRPKRFIVFISILILIIISIVTGIVFLFRNKNESGEEKEIIDRLQVYEALIQTKGADEYKTEEDRQAFFENGDVVLLFPEGHLWTASEKDELIIKIKIIEEEAQKIIQSEQREGAITRLRQFRLNLKKIGSDSNKIFNWDIVEEK